VWDTLGQDARRVQDDLSINAIGQRLDDYELTVGHAWS
jgi:hypothetical protein